LLLLFLSTRLKEAAYTGFAITFISAFTAHLSQEDPLPVVLQAVAMLGIPSASYLYFNKIRKNQGIYPRR